MYLSYSLNFADSAWHVFAAAFIFLLGAPISVFQHRIFGVPKRLALWLYVWHTIFCLFFFSFSQSNPADSNGYFINSLEFNDFPALGTLAVTFLISIFTQDLGLSYGGVFLVFNIIGFIGMLALVSVMHELTRNSSRNVRLLTLIILLLPGLSLWSSAIGKDAISFLGVCLACWASRDFVRRYPGMILGVILILIVRPHVAAIMLISLSATAIISGPASFMTRAFLLLAIIPTTGYALLSALTYIGLEGVASVDAISNYVQARQGQNLEGQLSVDIINMSVPMRMLSYMFRPLLFDSGGLLGLIISTENSILLMLMVAATYLWLMRRKSALAGFTWWFLMIYSLSLWFIMANTTANLGIAIRQKWMFMPMILILCFSYIGRPLANKQRARN